MTTITAPNRQGTRPAAQALAAALPADLTGISVRVVCTNLVATSPSFVDQLIKEILVERRAEALVLEAASDRVREYALRSADLRAVTHRVTFQ